MKYDYVKNIYIVFAMKRSGHHGVMDWIRFSHENNIVFYNDCKYGENPHDGCYNFWVNDKVYKRTALENDIFPKEANCLMWNYEDFDLDLYDEETTKKMINSITKKYDNLFLITVSRDSFNQQASTYFGTDKRRGIDLDLWKKYAREHLKTDSKIPDSINIDYSLWIKDEKKRTLYNKICGTKPFFPLYKIVSPHGDGSSFHRGEVNARIATLNANNRWKKILGTKEFELVCDDKEVMELAREMYGENYMNKIKR